MQGYLLLKNVNFQTAFAVAIHISMESTRLTVCSRYHYNENPSKIRCKLWKTLDGLFRDSTPLSILIKPDGKTLHGFGYDAQRRYAELEEEYDNCRYYFFKNITGRLVKSFKEVSCVLNV